MLLRVYDKKAAGSQICNRTGKITGYEITLFFNAEAIFKGVLPVVSIFSDFTFLAKNLSSTYRIHFVGNNTYIYSFGFSPVG